MRQELAPRVRVGVSPQLDLRLVMPRRGREEFGVSQVFDELERDWQRLCGDRRAVARLREVCVVVGAAVPGELERCVEQASRPVADEVLLLLVRRAVGGEGLAARVLLQLLLPGVRRLARTWWALGDDDERAAAALSAVWERIQRYPIERRPGRVAANILMDAGWQLATDALSQALERDWVEDLRPRLQNRFV
jgi:hypothetical protein